MDAYDRFAAFLEEHKISDGKAAERLGCHQTTVTRIRRRDRKPGLGVALRIQEMTSGWERGPIMAQEWAQPAAPDDSGPHPHPEAAAKADDATGTEG